MLHATLPSGKKGERNEKSFARYYEIKENWLKIRFAYLSQKGEKMKENVFLS